jgi:hypothetical protein
MKNARVIFENLTLKQAKTLAHWYEGQGEQDADVWFDTQGVKTPMTDVAKEGGFMKINGNDVHVYCK